jgi:hypothetical protein
LADTQLMNCAQCGDAAQVQFLLDHGADWRRYSRKAGYPALFFVLWQRNKQERSPILNAFAKVMPIDYQKSDKGQTFCRYDREQLAQTRNKTLLYVAMLNYKFDLIEPLLRLGANPNFVYGVMMSPTEYAAGHVQSEDPKTYYPILKQFFRYGGKLNREQDFWFLTKEQKEELAQEKSVFDVFAEDKAYVMRSYSPEIRRQHSYQELHGQALVSLLLAGSPVPGDVARIVCDYHGRCMGSDFFDQEYWTKEGFAAPLVQNAGAAERVAGSVVGNEQEGMLDGDKNEDGGAGDCDGDRENYGDGDDQKADY